VEWGILAALLLLGSSREPTRDAPGPDRGSPEARVVVFGPCCGPSASEREAEAG
jgi:hypothetical protein